MTDGDRVKPPWWLKATNRVMMTVSRLGLAAGAEDPAVLTVPGRKSGIPRSTPVTPMVVDGARYVVAGFPGADWVENVRAAGEVTLTRAAGPNACGWWSCRPRRPVRSCAPFRPTCPRACG
ncbi:hypothetical protein I546_0776 [Mycobacterium kansasii 732]|nr:hypothetical protein I546_0776 [Mycobacterium kansasii 732]